MSEGSTLKSRRRLIGGMTLVMIVMLCLLLSGALLYRHAPIHRCGDGYCGKGGEPYTAEQNRGFRIWEVTTLCVWAIGFPAVIVLSLTKLRHRR